MKTALSLSKGLVTRILLISLFAFAVFPYLSTQASSPIQTGDFTGTASEWAGVAHNYVSAPSTLSAFKATQKGTELYLLVTGTDMNVTGETFYIDSDNNPATGVASAVWTNATGLDYKIVDDQLYKYANNAWTAAEGNVTISKTATSVEASIDIASLGLSATGAMKVAFQKPGNNSLPEASQAMLAVDPAPAAAFNADMTFTVDADMADWAGIEPIGASADETTKMYAYETNGKLYVLVKGAMADFNDIYIDTDKSRDTGFQSWAWAAFGADYFMENGTGYKSTGTGWDWNGPDQGYHAAVQYAEAGPANDRTIEMSIPLADLGLAGPKNINLAFNGGSAWLPAPSTGIIATVKPNLPDVVVDANPAEWSELTPITTGNAGLESMKAFVKNQKLYILAEGTDITPGIHVYINKDNNSATGNTEWFFTNPGSDLLLEGDALYPSSLDGGAWNWDTDHPLATVPTTVISTTYAPAGKQIMEMSIDMSDWTDVSSTVRLGVTTAWDANRLPTAGTLPAATTLAGSVIVVDGLTSDWSNIDNQALATNTVFNLNAVQDNDKVYTFINGLNLNTQNIYYLDTDNNSATGYASSNWSGAGIDYKVERNILFKYISQDSSWMEVGPVYTNITSTGIGMYFYQSMIGKTAPGVIKIGYISKNTFLLPMSGQPMLTVDEIMDNQAPAHTFFPKESFALLNNPYMGWAPWSDNRDVAAGTPYPQAHSLVYVGMTWKDLEPTAKGVFDWEGIETKYQFAYWKAQGKKINLRIVLDLPGTTTHRDIPDWLYNELAVDGAANAGKVYDATADGIGKGFAPNYSNPLLISEHNELLQALAARYNNDPFIAFIQIGSLGHWGEFHNYPETDIVGGDGAGLMPNISVVNQYINQYLTNFTNKKAGMRKPYPIASSSQLGLFNDIFGDAGSTATWLGWAQNGWNDLNRYLDLDLPLEQKVLDPSGPAVIASSAMPDFWKYNYSGGEFTSGDAKASLQDSTIMEALKEARLSHTSFLGPESPTRYTVGNQINESVQANMDLLQKTMGYRYVLDSIVHTPNANAGDTVTLATYWNNKGVAPFYFNWPLKFALADASGSIIASSITAASGVDIRTWLPGKQTAATSLSIPSQLSSGAYTVLVSIVDPATNQPGIQLAIDGKRSDGWYALNQIAVTNTDNPNTDTHSEVHGQGPTTSPTTIPTAAPTATPTPDPASGPRQVVALGSDALVAANAQTSDGRVLTKISVDSEKLSESFKQLAKMDGSANGASKEIEITIDNRGQSAEISLPGKALREAILSSPNAIISIKLDDSGYRLPLSIIDFSALSKQLGEAGDNISIHIHIEKVSAKINADLNKLAGELGMKSLVDGVDFKVIAEANGKQAELNQFGGTYVERNIIVPQKISAEETTAIEFDPEKNQASFVPAEFKDMGAGKTDVVIKRNGNSIYSVVSSKRSFTDIQGHWAEKDITLLASKLLVAGKMGQAFMPNESITRAEMATLIVKGLGLKLEPAAGLFTDVASSAWYADFVETAGKAKLITGFGDGSFKPNERITREQLAVMISNVFHFIGKKAGVEGDYASLSAFADKSLVSDWAMTALAQCVEMKIIQGQRADTIAPKSSASRAEAVVMLERMLQAIHFING